MKTLFVTFPLTSPLSVTLEQEFGSVLQESTQQNQHFVNVDLNNSC